MAEKKYRAEKRLLYNNKDQSSKQALYDVLKSLDEAEYLISIRVNKPVRSIKANAFYHFILNLITTESEAGASYTHDSLHDICKDKFNYEIVELPKSGAILRGRSTSDLDTEEFSNFVQKVKAWAFEEFDVIVPEQSDVSYKKWMDAENNYHKKFYGF